MAGVKKFLFIHSDGFHEEQADNDELELGGLTMTGDIAFDDIAKVTGLGAASGAGDGIAYGQSGASLAGLNISANGINMNGELITGVGAPSAGGDAANKKYVDDLVTAGVTWREITLHQTQLDNAEGVRSAIVMTMADQPEAGDTIILSNGTVTRTYGATSGGDVQYTIGGSKEATMANLAAAIEGDGSAVWNAYVSTDLDTLAGTVVVIIEKDSAAALSKLYGTWHTQAHVQLVDFTGLNDYNSSVLSSLLTSVTNANFGFHRVPASLNPGELHEVRNNDTLYTWNDDASTWQAVLGPASLPDGTSAPGGGTKGKLGVDSDLGLNVVSGILGIDLAASGGLEFGTGGDAGDLQLFIHATTPGLDIDGANGLRVTWDGAHGIIVGASGIEVEIDDTPDTLDYTSAGLKVVGVPSQFLIGGSATNATVSADNLTELTDGSETTLHTHAGLASSERVAYSYTVGTGGVTAADPVYLTSGGDTVAMADASDNALSWVIGIAKTTEVATDPVEVVSGGVAKAVFSGKSAGQKFYLDDGGGLATTPPTGNMRVIFIGVAVNATDLLVAIRDFGKKAAV